MLAEAQLSTSQHTLSCTGWELPAQLIPPSSRAFFSSVLTNSTNGALLLSHGMGILGSDSKGLPSASRGCSNATPQQHHWDLGDREPNVRVPLGHPLAVTNSSWKEKQPPRESLNLKKIWTGKDLKDQPLPLPCHEEITSTRPGGKG